MTDQSIRKIRERTTSGKTRIVRDRKLNLLNFAPGFTFSREFARYDKLEINFDLATISENQREAVIAHFSRIAETSCFLRQDGNHATPKLMARKKGGYSRGDGRVFENLLFSGEIRLERDHDNDRQYKIRAYININPTRFFAHNPPGRRISDDLKKLDVYARPETARRLESLDFNDNVILPDRLKEARQTDWDALTRDYLHLIREKIQAEMRKCENNIISYRYNTDIAQWSIRHAEIYWEFKTENNDAPDIAGSFCHHLKQYFLHIREQFHLSDIDRSYGGASYVFRSDNRNISICIYAKTKNRIRVECRFNKNPKSMYTDISNENFSSGEEEKLFALLNKLIVKAQNSHLRKIQNARRDFEHPTTHSASYLASQLSGISAEAQNNSIFYTRMIRSYQSTGKIIEMGIPDYDDFLKRLEQRSILKKLKKERGKPRAYRLMIRFF